MKKRVLVVDDAAFMRSYVKRILEENGLEVCGEASTALEAVEKYRELNPNLVTLDIVMPRIEELDGLGALRDILRRDIHANIIIISAIGDDALVNEALQYGAKGFLVKPFKPQELLELTRKILE